MLKQSCFLCNIASSEIICDKCQKYFITNSNRCVSCAKIIHNDLSYCPQCLQKSPIFANAYAIYNYEGVISRLIQEFKYNEKLFLAKFFADKLNDAFNIIYKNNKPDLIIPMPIHKKRIKERGFNQAVEILAKIKKHYSNIDISSCIRIKHTPPLVRMDLKERRKNIKNSFKVIKTINANHVLLVDDVMTTGVSFSELAKTIKKHNKNIKKIDVLCLARAVS